MITHMIVSLHIQFDLRFNEKLEQNKHLLRLLMDLNIKCLPQVSITLIYHSP